MGYRGRRSTVEEIAKQKLAGPPGATGANGTSGVISVTAPITNSGSSTAANIGINTTTLFTSPALTGTPTSTTAAVDTNTTQIATTAFVVGQASATNPTALSGTAAVGTSLRYARQDHVHPTTGLAVLASANTFTNKQTITPTTGTPALQLNAAATSVGLAIKANATTPDDLVQFQDSNSNVITRVIYGGGIIAVEPIIRKSNVTGTVDLDCIFGTTFALTATGTNAILNLINLPAAGSITLTLFITQGTGGSKTIDWASTQIAGVTSGVKWAGTAPSLSTTAGQVDVITLIMNRHTILGDNIYGFLSGKNFA